MCGPFPLLDDAEGEVRYPGALDHPGALQLYGSRAEMLEQPHPVPEQDGHQVHVYLLEKPRPDALLRDASSSHRDTSLSPATALAFSTALSTPSVTKVKGEPS